MKFINHSKLNSLGILHIGTMTQLYVLNIVPSLKRLKYNSYKRMQETIIKSILNVLNIGLSFVQS